MPSPTSVEPVKVMPLTRRCVTRASPTSPPRPIMRLTTPAGTPASWSISTMITEVSGVSDAGLSTTAPPAGRGPPSRAQGFAGGKLHLAYPAVPLGGRLDDRLAHLQRHRLCEFVAAAPPDLYQAVNVPHALGG